MTPMTVLSPAVGFFAQFQFFQVPGWDVVAGLQVPRAATRTLPSRRQALTGSLRSWQVLMPVVARTQSRQYPSPARTVRQSRLPSSHFMPVARPSVARSVSVLPWRSNAM